MSRPASAATTGDPFDEPASGPSRARALVVLAAAIVLGLAVQPFRTVTGTDAIGTMAYAAAAVGVLALLLPHRGAALPGAIGTALACAVELFQLTGIPSRLAEISRGFAFVLGDQFDAVDLLWLVIGGVLATVALALRRSAP